MTSSSNETSNSNSTRLYKGGHGLIRSLYSGSASISSIKDNPLFFVNPLQANTSSPYEGLPPNFQEVVLTPQSERNSPRAGSFVQVYQTLFKAQSTGNHTFHVTNDDQVVVYFNPKGPAYNRSDLV